MGQGDVTACISASKINSDNFGCPCIRCVLSLDPAVKHWVSGTAAVFNTIVQLDACCLNDVESLELKTELTALKHVTCIAASNQSKDV